MHFVAGSSESSWKLVTAAVALGVKGHRSAYFSASSPNRSSGLGLNSVAHVPVRPSCSTLLLGPRSETAFTKALIANTDPSALVTETKRASARVASFGGCALITTCSPAFRESLLQPSRRNSAIGAASISQTASAPPGTLARKKTYACGFAHSNFVTEPSSSISFFSS